MTYKHNTRLSMAQTQNLHTPKTILIFGVHHKVFTDSEVVEAAEQLMQLSDEDHCSNTTASDGNNKNLEATFENDLFGGVCGQEEITSRKIQEILGKDDGEEVERQRPERKRRYRSIADIYRETSTVVNVRNQKKNKVRY